MKIQPLRTVTKMVFDCPECGAEMESVDRAQSFGPWYCDGCARGWMGKVQGDSVALEEHGSKALHTLALLRRGDVLLVVRTLEFQESAGRSMADRRDSHRFYFDEHTCPTNYLPNVIEVILDGEIDPHGVFEYVGELQRIFTDNELEALLDDHDQRAALVAELLASTKTIVET